MLAATVLAAVLISNTFTPAPSTTAFSRSFNPTGGSTDYATYLQPGTPPALLSIQAFPVTMCVWFKMDTGNIPSPPAQKILVALDNTANGNNQIALEWGAVSAQNKISAAVKTSSTTRTASSNTVTADAWHHACGVYKLDGSSLPTIRNVYLDGVETLTTGTAISRDPFASGGPTQIHVGAKTDVSGVLQSWWPGKLAHVAIWADELTYTQIKDLAGAANGGTNGTADNPLNPIHPAPVAYYPFLDGSGNSAVGTYHLTFTGTPAQSSVDAPPVEAAP